MSDRYIVVSGFLFGIVAVLQALRAVNGWAVNIGTLEIPVWASWIAAIFAGCFCAWAFQSRQK